MICCAEDLLEKVEEYGFLPFFRNDIQGFSVEEMCLPELWFTAQEGHGSFKIDTAVCG